MGLLTGDGIEGGMQGAAPAEGYPNSAVGGPVFGKSRKIAENRAVKELERSTGQTSLFANNMGWMIRGDMDCLCRWPVRLRRTTWFCARVGTVRLRRNPCPWAGRLNRVCGGGLPLSTPYPERVISKDRRPCRHALPVLPLLPEWGAIFLLDVGTVRLRRMSEG